MVATKRKEIVGNISGRCPACEKGILEYGKRKLGYEFIAYPFVCKSCGKRGEEYYEEVYIKSVIK